MGTSPRSARLAPDSASGVEPFRVSLASIRGALAERLGRGCSGSKGTPSIRSIGIPRLGQWAFTIALERARVSAPTFLLLGVILQPVADVGRCVPSSAAPVISAALMSDAAGRAALTLAKREILDVVIGG